MNLEKINRTIQALEKNRIHAELLKGPEELIQRLNEMVPGQARVASGGSVTLSETGVEKWLTEGNREYLTMDEAFTSDWYFMSSNAITEEGELWNVDGNGNRVSALIYGPKHVIIVAGINKIVSDRAAAEERVRTTAAPKNSKRLNRKTGCAKTGYCVDCRSPERICCTTVISSYQRHEGRIQVFLLPGEYGF